MKFILKTALVFTFFMISKSSFSQDLIIKTHTYSFTDCENKDVVYKIQEDVKKINFVTNVDIRYNSYKKTGVMIVNTSETMIRGESDEGFSPTWLKEVLIKDGAMPYKYRLIDPTTNTVK
jgi:hypothetical protein